MRWKPSNALGSMKLWLEWLEVQLAAGTHQTEYKKFQFSCTCLSPSEPDLRGSDLPLLNCKGIWDLFSLELLSFQLHLNCFSFTRSLHRYLESVRLSRSSSLLVTHQMVSFPIHWYQSLIVSECILPWA